MNLKLFTDDGTIYFSHNEESNSYELKINDEIYTLSEISVFPESSMWDFDKRFGDRPVDNGKLKDCLEFDSFIFPLFFNYSGRDEGGMPFLLGNFCSLVYLEIGPSEAKSIFVLKMT